MLGTAIRNRTRALTDYYYVAIGELVDYLLDGKIPRFSGKK
jgi:hypothetical protein